jgi:hypothetical protein
VPSLADELLPMFQQAPCQLRKSGVSDAMHWPRRQGFAGWRQIAGTNRQMGLKKPVRVPF